MSAECRKRRSPAMAMVAAGVAPALFCIAATAAQPAWKPARNVEIIVGVSPGGGVDRTARTLQKILQDRRLLEVNAGGDIRKLKVVVFSSGGESTTALLGGHVGLVTTPAATALPAMQSGTLRMLAVAAPRRLEGALAQVPTWRELGYDVVVSNWRPVMGPRGLTADQTAFWEDVIRRFTQTAEWQDELAATGGLSHYMGSRELAVFLETQRTSFRTKLTELGLAR